MNIEFELNCFRDCPGIVFAHKRFSDSPENHRLHINKNCEIYVFVEGDADYIVENHYYTLHRGDILLINPHEVHKAVLKSTAEYERFYLLFREGAFRPFQESPISGLLSKPAGGENLISFPEAEREEILDLLNEISLMAQRKEASYRMLAKILEFVHRIEQGYSAEPAVLPCGSLDSLLSAALLYIDENLTSLQSVSEIAKKLNVSLPYLSMRFSRSVGTPLKSYIQAKRIAFAKRLLDSGRSVTDACYESGFNECSYFIRVFRKYIGMTPLRYRQTKQS